MYIISMRAFSPTHAHDTTELKKLIGRLNSHLLSLACARALSVSHTCTQHYCEKYMYRATEFAFALARSCAHALCLTHMHTTLK